MIEMAELLERMAKGERVSPEEARSIKKRLQALIDDFRAPLEQEPADASSVERRAENRAQR